MSTATDLRGRVLRALDRAVECHDLTREEALDLLDAHDARQPRPLRVVDGVTDLCPAPGYRQHVAVGAGAVSAPYLCHGCQTWFALPCEHDTLGCRDRTPHDEHTKVGDGRPCCGWPPRCFVCDDLYGGGE